jgi:hypothetical protein
LQRGVRVRGRPFVYGRQIKAMVRPSGRRRISGFEFRQGRAANPSSSPPSSPSVILVLVTRIPTGTGRCHDGGRYSSTVGAGGDPRDKHEDDGRRERKCRFPDATTLLAIQGHLTGSFQVMCLADRGTWGAAYRLIIRMFRAKPTKGHHEGCTKNNPSCLLRATPWRSSRETLGRRPGLSLPESAHHNLRSQPLIPSRRYPAALSAPCPPT